MADDRFPEEYDGGQLLGVNGRGAPVYYDEAGRATFEGMATVDGVVGRENERPVADGSTVEDLVDDTRERAGWTWLSDFAKSHLPVGDDSE
ncbi:hypothetical protein [Halomarina litorea]|uniref:hypothetical protein n=1 Tax=Halomarina litorea TaxID=2961595 RepID=UPI0020C583C0|nr:hypothetical protein [Halomarina sp. BCD28]